MPHISFKIRSRERVQFLKFASMTKRSNSSGCNGIASPDFVTVRFSVSMVMSRYRSILFSFPVRSSIFSMRTLQHVQPHALGYIPVIFHYEDAVLCP